MGVFSRLRSVKVAFITIIAYKELHLHHKSDPHVQWDGAGPLGLESVKHAEVKWRQVCFLFFCCVFLNNERNIAVPSTIKKKKKQKREPQQ